jgi:hypothetical protein
LTAHAELAIRPESDPRELSERLRQAAVLVSGLIEQTSTVERVRRRAERRCNFGARLIELGGDPSVIRTWGGTSGKSGRRAQDRN